MNWDNAMVRDRPCWAGPAQLAESNIMPKSEQSKQDSNLDVLRSIAVLTVLGFHLAQLRGGQESWGRFGVLIFFVHTSLVLMMSLERLAARHSHIALPFYIQRVFRIYPLSILCVLCVVICHIPPSIYEPYRRPGAFMLISNLLLAQNTGVGSVSGPLWSLPYEVQMYVLLPFLYLLLKRHAGWRVLLALVILSVGFGSLQLLSAYGKVAQFFPCFMGGILAFWLRRRQKAVFPAGLWPVWVIALGLFYEAASFFGKEFFICLALGGSAGWFRDIKPGFIAALARQIAKYSYGIYLAHAPLIWICFRELPLGSPAIRLALFFLLLALVVILLYHCVEAPFIALGRRLAAPSDGIRSRHTAEP